MLNHHFSGKHARHLFRLLIAVFMCQIVVTNGAASPFFFTTGAPDGRMATASRPSGPGIEIESADDFILAQPTTISSATFTGLLTGGVTLANINFVGVEIYRVFPKDSANPPSGHVPTRVNSPSDFAFDSRDSAALNLTFTPSVLNPNFNVANTVVNGINPIPTQTTGGEGPASGQEVSFQVTFTTPFVLPADHYFFKPTVGVSSGGAFLWLSTATPPQFTGDLQSWIRNANLDPDWLRIGTDIVGGATPPRFNAAFSLSGQVCQGAPTIVCPASITTFTDSGQVTATVNPGTPVANDDCGVQSVTGVRSDGKPLNAPYPIGLTTIVWTATETGGGAASCGQSIAVTVPSGQRRIP